MRRTKGVVSALGALRKPRNTTQLAQRVHAVASARQNLVRIGLVAHIPHQTVVRGIEHMVQRHGQLHRAQVGAQVPPRLGNTVNHEGTQLRGQHLELAAREAAQLGRVVHTREQGIGGR